MKCMLQGAVLWVALCPPVVRVSASEPAVRTGEFHAPSVKRTLKYNIALPRGYDASTERYPVLYLLHGWTSSYPAWGRYGAHIQAAPYALIVVMPDAGNSWYVNWARSEDGQKNAWEDYVTRDLIGHIDETYRTIARREGRAINGLSMGGYGAMVVGLRNPDLFCSVGSHSGALKFGQDMIRSLAKGEGEPESDRTRSTKGDPRIGTDHFDSGAERSPEGDIFLTPEDCHAHDPYRLVTKIPRDKLPHLHLDCGTDDGFLSATRGFLDVLTEHKIPFTYAESPGDHNSKYWRREVAYSIAVQYHYIQRSLGRIRPYNK